MNDVLHDLTDFLERTVEEIQDLERRCAEVLYEDIPGKSMAKLVEARVLLDLAHDSCIKKMAEDLGITL